MSNKKWLSSKGWISTLGIGAVALGITFAALTYSRFLTDNFNYLSYRPDVMIESIASATSMSEHGRFLFYASKPMLEDAEGFNEKCGRSEIKTAILGCYNGQTIHIYDIQDDRLAGIRETTAAHEMLHAAYDRLGEDDRQEIDRLIQREFEKLKIDDNLRERLAYYDRSEPGERNNELHSIIGTEIAVLEPELERYYSRYFADRSAVVRLHGQYESVFRELRDRADELNRVIAELNAAIKNDTVAYNRDAETLQDEIASFNSRAEQGDFDSQAEFNRQRLALTRKVNSLETVRSAINANVKKYNELVTELNEIATQTSDLNRSVDSTLTPAPSL